MRVGMAGLDVPLRAWVRVGLGLAAIACLAALGWVAWHVEAQRARASVPADPAAATRQYLAADACLLTGGQGIDGQPQAAAWAAMRDSSLATRAKVQYLPVHGSAGALPYLASLVQRRCDVIVAVGPAQDAVVDAEAGRYPAVRFITIGTRMAPHVANIVPARAGQLRVAVRALLTATLRQVMAN
jgi:basic membrane lipoprotein Med (substrate-binding protein (PBP1-ABC) superfamily)